MSETIGGPACAHLRVSYMTMNTDDGLTRGWWGCQTCQARFAPLPAAREEARREVTGQIVDGSHMCNGRIQPYPSALCSACPSGYSEGTVHFISGPRMRELEAMLRAEGRREGGARSDKLRERLAGAEAGIIGKIAARLGWVDMSSAEELIVFLEEWLAVHRGTAAEERAAHAAQLVALREAAAKMWDEGAEEAEDNFEIFAPWLRRMAEDTRALPLPDAEAALEKVKEEAVRDFLAKEPSGEWTAAHGESGAGEGEGVWRKNAPEDARALVWFDYSDEGDDEDDGVRKCRDKARAVANALNALGAKGRE